MEKQYQNGNRSYSLRMAYSKTMPGYIYHVLTVGRFMVEVPCISDGHNVAQAVIEGRLDLAQYPRYTGKDER